MTKRIKLKKSADLTPKLKAFKYQEDAYNAIKDLEYSAIFHEQGLGKTKIAIDLALNWLSQDIDTVLIVTKKILVANWQKEFNVHTSIKPAIIGRDKVKNYYVFIRPYQVVITNFEALSSEKEHFELYLKTRNVAIIIDESTKIKNPKSKLTNDFFDLSNLFKKRVIMTGTPIANRPYDIWSQIYFLDRGKSLGNSFDEFKKNTDLSNKLVSNDIKRENFETAVSEIYEKISSFSVRETKDSAEISLPDKKYYNILVDFEQKQKELYQKVQKELVVFIKKNGTTIIDDTSPVLKRLLRLVQVTSNPRLIDDSYCIESSKEKKLDELICKITSNNEKCIVWSNFIENVDYYRKKYEEFNAVKIHGKMNILDRNKSVQKFIDNPDCKILIATPQAAKEGLTLTIANHVIFYDRGFSLDDYLQAQDRIHRISQTKTCYVYNIMIEESIDVWIDLLLKAKQNAAFLGQGDINLDKYKDLSDYSFGDIIREILNDKEC